MSFLVIIVLVLIAIILRATFRCAVTAYRRSAFSRANGCMPAVSYPHRDPIFGLDLFFEGIKLLKVGKFLSRAQQRYELVNNGVNTYTQLVLGDRVIVTREPENIKTVLAAKFRDFEFSHRRKDSCAPILGRGIFTTDGKEWEASRALLRPSFARSLVGDLEVFETHASKMIARIPRDGSTVDLQELFFMLTLDSATDFLFGQSTNVLGTGEARHRGKRFAEHLSYTTSVMSIRGRVGKLAAILPDQEYEDGIKFIHEYIQYYVRRTLEQKAKRGKSVQASSKYVFLEHLAMSESSEKKIQDELLSILLAGRDTTASLLAHLWYTLARRPDVLQKLRSEVLHLGDRAPSFEQIKEMRYLQYCLNEALRLYPVVPMNSRTAVTDTVLPVGGGPVGKSPIFIKSGTQIIYQVWAMHRRKDFYGEDAEVFRPERWETLRPGWQYLPFNGGPRICIGQKFALTEAGYTTIRLLQAFKAIESRDPEEYKESLSLTLSVGNGVKVGLTPA